jgi:hypothetical protein
MKINQADHGHISRNNSQYKKKKNDESDNEINFTEKQQWPRFFIMESTDKDQLLTAFSPFAIAKGIQGLAGQPKQITKLRSGAILIEISTRAHCQNLLHSTFIVNTQIRVAPHKALNTSKEVIRTRDVGSRDCM